MGFPEKYLTDNLRVQDSLLITELNKGMVEIPSFSCITSSYSGFNSNDLSK